MNIAIDIRPLMSRHRAGVGEYTYELLNALFKIDCQNQYFLFYNSNKDVASYIPRWTNKNVHFIQTKWPNKWFNFCQKLFKYPKIDRIIKKRCRASLDYFFSPNINFTTLSQHTKQILTIHDLSFKLYPQYYSLKRWLWHKIIDAEKQSQKADIILVPSKNTKRDIVEYFKINPKKIKVLYPGINFLNNDSGVVNSNEKVKEIRQKYNLPDNFILYLGTIEPRKNIIGIIKAFEKLKSQFPISNIQYLIIAGANGWKNRKIYQQAKKSKYHNCIKFIGYVAPADKLPLYSLAKIFIYPSFYEGFGFPVLEAMSVHTPVITSNRSSLPEIVQNSAYLVNPHKTDELVRAIKELMENNKLREFYIQSGLKQIKKFAWKKTAEAFLNVCALGSTLECMGPKIADSDDMLNS